MYRSAFTVIFMLAVSSLYAQNDAAPNNPRVASTRLTLEKADAERPVNNGMSGKAYRRMLPAGFKDIVEAEQRDRIYATQKEYHAAIQRLKARIEALEEERDRAYEAILNEEQREHIRKYRENRKAASKKTAETLLPANTEQIESDTP
ncbi:MAG TPA: hypothetical protein DEB39_15195 [Planctomycetaceae bacterium]|nr:hypothetical protein [Planctomycetaceae bacterium]